MRALSLAVALALAVPIGVAIAPPALACGGLFCQRVPVEQAGERILFATDGENVTAHVQIQYQGEAKDFSWIVPVPTKPTLGVGSDQLFQALRNATQPRFQVDIDQTVGDCNEPRLRDASAAARPQAASGAGADMSVQEQQIGPFDTAILQANDSSVLKKWLSDNEYTIPAAIDPLLDPYVANKYYFIALKLQKNRSAGDLQPIVFKYQSTKPGVPIRLTGVAATPDMGVYVWVLGKNRAVPENYRHAEINEARIDWPSGGGNYPAVVTEAMNEAGGQAFVTDYAGKNDIVDISNFDATRLEDFAAGLKSRKDAVAFVRYVLQNQYILQQAGGPVAPIADIAFGGQTDRAIAFLKRYVPRPAGVEVDDSIFYDDIETYAPQVANSTVDTEAAFAEVQQTVVVPARDITTMFKQLPYLSRLYTTMSPDEMTQDPMFVFNPDMGDVANVHVAKGVRQCSKDYDFGNAPVELTLSSGLKFLVTGGPTGITQTPVGSDAPGQKVVMPAALRIQQAKTTGQAAVVLDNTEKVSAVLRQLTNASKAISNGMDGSSISISVLGVKVATINIGAGTSGSSGGKSGGNLKNDVTRTEGGGFGCAGCANPAKTGDSGKGEGLSFALIGAGFLALRVRRKRK